MKPILFTCLTLTLASFLGAQNIPLISPGRTPTPLDGLGRNIGDSFLGTNAFLQGTGYAATILIVTQGLDYNVHNYFSARRQYDPYTTPAVWLGYTLPVVLGGGLYVAGRIEDENELTAAGSAVLQASLIAQLYVSALKAVTGRPNPDPQSFSDMNAASKTFRFGFLRGGLHYGWPSGHLAVNTAAVTSLMAFYPESISLKILGSLYIAYLVFGVSAHEGATMHWFSDVAAGTLFGLAIGPTVGRSFRQACDRTNVGDGLRVSPAISPNGVRIQFVWGV